METIRYLALALVVGFVALTVGLQLLAARRAAQLKGTPLPKLPGALGERINASPTALIYFFTPTCAACRPVTPRMKALAEAGKPVFPVDATRDPDVASALSVMATPTTVEVQQGKVVGMHVGPIAPDVWARFGA